MEYISFKDYWEGLTPDAKRQLAERIHSSYNYLSQLAHGKRSPSRRTVELICIVTGLNIDFPQCCED